MFNITFTADKLFFDVTKFTKRMKSEIRRRMRVAARKFIRAGIIGVPFDTGMARGTYLNLGRLLRVAIPSSGGRTGVFAYGYGSKIPKTPESGAALATQGADVFTEEGDKFSFYYGNDVIHYNINEFFGRIPSAPWLSYEKGQAAFLAELEQNLIRKIPSVREFIVVTTISAGPNGISTKVRQMDQTTPEGEDDGG